MSGARVQRKPTFLRQAVLILLPTLVLAGMGWVSLRQDKALARHDAEERARTIADDLVQKLWSELNARPANEANAFSFQVNAAGRLTFPPEYSPLPVPRPFDPAELNAEQAPLWLKLQNSAADNPEALVQNARDFMESDPPDDFAAAACYNLGLEFIRQKKFPEAAEMFDLVAGQFPRAVGESGLPLQPLAQFQLVELGLSGSSSRNFRFVSSWRPPRNRMGDDGETPVHSQPLPHFVSLDSFLSNIVFRPTAMTSYFFKLFQERANEDDWIRARGTRRSTDERRSEVERRAPALLPQEEREQCSKWQRAWEEHEVARRLFAAANRDFRTHAELMRPVPPLAVGEAADHPVSAGAAIAALSALAPPLFWFVSPEPLTHHAPNASVAEIEERNWLAVRFDEGATSRWFVCRGESQVGARASALVKDAKQIPEYFGVSLQVAGKNIESYYAPVLNTWAYHQLPGSKGPAGSYKAYSGEKATTVLASAARSEHGIELLKVRIYLTSPTALFDRQRIRAFWFGSLIVVATLAALAGLLTAWRAFRQQQRLSEMKSNFVSSVSHELRAPIASVRLMAESLDRGKIQEPQKQNEYFRFIVQECRRLSSLIENVLDFSRIEQGRKQYEFEPTDLAALARETVKLMEPYAGEKGVKLEMGTFNIQHSTFNVQGPKVPAGPGSGGGGDFEPAEQIGNADGRRQRAELNVDGRAIQQALVNLIDNAIKHSPKGETVTVGLEEVSGADCPVSGEALREQGTQPPAINHQPSTLNLSVSDHGAGIPAEEHEKIFERFYRRGSELRRETQGVGIGLSIVQHIVEAHGGRVRVQSEVGKGSRFTIELPVTK